ncbi:hypothetical protein NADFUDRAFT_50130 [Nadsonia fulvescens var. elongata DSM 6958]|uniref:HTH APSES-type domain-containing protein n=1 Tax=Nadsonia fulvescens var. elongata DSM 6958 TaxID=857566 RepID=A0A1E3PL94_9ASCO|nr:hypothetical protein NADFUDRAFT_50130 [Nadsonia fulvescens var. elongata DSM 6958]
MEVVSNSLLSDSSPEYIVDGFKVLYPVQKAPDINRLLCEVPDDQKNLIPNPELIATKRYTTSIDERNFLTVYEYQVNNQWIIWDYHTGYVLLTGIWKAIGNNKADIVKLVENSPELSPYLKRIRGGFLKIQGTWLPYEMVKKLAGNFCYNIRYSLIPVFGLDFPSLCLLPSEVGFGHLQLNIDPALFYRNGPKGSGRRRRRKSNDQSITLTKNREIYPKLGKNSTGAGGTQFNNSGISNSKRVNHTTNKLIQKRRNTFDSSFSDHILTESNNNNSSIKAHSRNISCNDDIEYIKQKLESSNSSLPSLDVNWNAIDSDEESGDDRFSTNDKLYIENILTRRSSISGTLNSYKHLGSTSSRLYSDYSYKISRNKSYTYDNPNIGIYGLDQTQPRRNSLPETEFLTQFNSYHSYSPRSWSGFKIPPLPDLSHGIATNQVSTSASTTTISTDENCDNSLYDSKENNNSVFAHPTSPLSFAAPKNAGSRYLNIKSNPQEFLEILKATKSLQQISLGGDDSKIMKQNASGYEMFNVTNKSMPSEKYGDNYKFEYDGQIWNWDGNERLSLAKDEDSMAVHATQDFSRNETLPEERANVMSFNIMLSR